MTDFDFSKLVDLKLLLSIPHLGPNRIKNLLQKFYTPNKILSSNFEQLISTGGISQKIAYRILNINKNRNELKNLLEIELEKLNKINANIISILDEEYPCLLKNIFDPPILLYKKGGFAEEDKNAIAIVGTRKPTEYGKKEADKVSKSLVNNNITIVSGMARGIDSIAQKSAISNNGRTIAVLGSGIDVIYPPENKTLYSDICESGVVLTEYTPGTKPDAMNFPKRNRIISGLSLGTVIIETGITGGALQTASFALDQNREVFAIPGNIESKFSEGTNRLIQKGEAKLITKVEDIFEELKLSINQKQKKKKENIQLNLFEEKILNVIKDEPLHIDKISELTNLTTSDCLVQLLSMEFKGVIKQLPGKIFSVN